MKPKVVFIILCLFLLCFCIQSVSQGLEKEPIMEIEGVTAWKIPGESAFFYKAKMDIDADGAPNAYHPTDIGLDNLKNAKNNQGEWVAIVVNSEGKPVVQGPEDPFLGYYISTTSLQDRTKKVTDPRRYVDYSKIPYIVLPARLAKGTGTRLGDFVTVINTKNRKIFNAVYADQGPGNKLGEGSMALAEALGIPSNPRTGGTGKEKYLIYIVFPGSGDAQPQSLEDINLKGSKLFQKWGGMSRVEAIFSE